MWIESLELLFGASGSLNLLLSSQQLSIPTSRFGNSTIATCHITLFGLLVEDGALNQVWECDGFIRHTDIGMDWPSRNVIPPAQKSLMHAVCMTEGPTSVPCISNFSSFFPLADGPTPWDPGPHS